MIFLVRKWDPKHALFWVFFWPVWCSVTKSNFKISPGKRAVCRKEHWASKETFWKARPPEHRPSDAFSPLVGKAVLDAWRCVCWGKRFLCDLSIAETCSTRCFVHFQAHRRPVKSIFHRDKVNLVFFHHFQGRGDRWRNTLFYIRTVFQRVQRSISVPVSPCLLTRRHVCAIRCATTFFSSHHRPNLVIFHQSGNTSFSSF